MTITVTNTLERPDGTAWAYATVKIGLVGAGFTSGGVQIQHVTKARSDATGLVTVALTPNNTGEAYVWTNPDRQQYTFQVPASGGPYTLQALLVTPTAASDPATTQAAVLGLLSGFVAKPGSGDAVGSVPVKQSDGSVAYGAAQVGVSVRGSAAKFDPSPALMVDEFQRAAGAPGNAPNGQPWNATNGAVPMVIAASRDGSGRNVLTAGSNALSSGYAVQDASLGTGVVPDVIFQEGEFQLWDGTVGAYTMASQDQASGPIGSSNNLIHFLLDDLHCVYQVAPQYNTTPLAALSGGTVTYANPLKIGLSAASIGLTSGSCAVTGAAITSQQDMLPITSTDPALPAALLSYVSAGNAVLVERMVDLILLSGNTAVSPPAGYTFDPSWNGRPVVHPNLPAGTTLTYIDSTHATLSNAPTATGTVMCYIGVPATATKTITAMVAPPSYTIGHIINRKLGTAVLLLPGDNGVLRVKSDALRTSGGVYHFWESSRGSGSQAAFVEWRRTTLAKIDGATFTGPLAKLGAALALAVASIPATVADDAAHTAATLQNSWHTGASNPAGYRKFGNGKVHIRGGLDTTTGAVTNTVAFTLPVGYRPPTLVEKAIVGTVGSTWVFCVLIIGTDGTVKVELLSSATSVFIDCEFDTVN